MAGQGGIIDDPGVRARWEGFQWTPENARQAKEIVGRYPEGRQMSASIPLLDLAQRQVGAETNTQGWLPLPVMEFVARELSDSRLLLVATYRADEMSRRLTETMGELARIGLQKMVLTGLELSATGQLLNHLVGNGCSDDLVREIHAGYVEDHDRRG